MARFTTQRGDDVSRKDRLARFMTQRICQPEVGSSDRASRMDRLVRFETQHECQPLARPEVHVVLWADYGVRHRDEVIECA